MTNEEAIKYFEHDRFRRADACEAVLLIIAALRAQQTPATLDRSRWEGCICCTLQSQVRAREKHGYRYCEHCGRPLNEEAWAELERRIK